MNLTQEILLYELKSNYACRKRFNMPECKLFPPSPNFTPLKRVYNLTPFGKLVITLGNVFGEEISLKCPESRVILNAYTDLKSIYFK